MNPSSRIVFQKVLLSVAAVFALVLKTAFPTVVPRDSLSVALIVLAFLPWLSTVVKAAEITGVGKIEFFELKRQVEDQQALINTLVQYSMSSSIYNHLCGIALLRDYRYKDDDGNRREMYFLRDNGLIRPRQDGGFLDFGAALNGVNLVEIAEPTPVGVAAVKLRQQDIPRNMLDDVKNLRVHPNEL